MLIWRLFHFIIKFYRLRLWRFLPSGYRQMVAWPSYILTLFMPWRWVSPKNYLPKERALRLFFEEMGPIFIKLGQLLSTRLDLLSKELAAELCQLQDNVPPFPTKQAKEICLSTLGDKFDDLNEFSQESLAAASIAQVHTAKLGGRGVIVKVRRPNVKRQVRRDCAVMMVIARYLGLFFDRDRFRFKEVVLELQTSLNGEMDFVREAANASQIRRNFLGDKRLYVPEVFWDYCNEQVMVQERIYGPNIKDRTHLERLNVNFEKLAFSGIEIFFTQVFEHSFFHADMHPGNIFIDVTDPQNPKYQAVDFGIVGSLSQEDKHYLAHNMLAFFERDYAKVARLHVESGWVPSTADKRDLENALRAVCEPIFKKPLKEISFGQTLLRLLQVASDHKMIVQPQLILLQKTLLAVEGLGRELYPDLDIWTRSAPILKRWIGRELGPRAQLTHFISLISPAIKKAEKYLKSQPKPPIIKENSFRFLTLGLYILIVVEIIKLV